MNIVSWFNNFRKKEIPEKIEEPLNLDNYLLEIEKELEGNIKLLNGQLRGFINTKAREENLELMTAFINSVYTKGFEDGYEYKTTIDKINN